MNPYPGVVSMYSFKGGAGWTVYAANLAKPFAENLGATPQQPIVLLDMGCHDAKNADMRFGAFGVDDDGDILFEHTIVGSTCDKEELRSSVMAVALTADQFDDEIVARWGGQRALDRIR